MYNELESFVIVKYGSLDTMYEEWITGQIEINDDELDLLAFRTGHSIDKLEELKENLIRVMNA